MYEAPLKPETPDYYYDLGLTAGATLVEIKKSFHTLALLHHPDKKAPGLTFDAVEFRRAREAYEVLGDTEERKSYDIDYWWICSQWSKYRRQLKDWKRQQEAERLRKVAQEEERLRAAEELEQRQFKEEAARQRAEAAKTQQWQEECDKNRRYSMADWAYCQAQRLKEEEQQREENERWDREREEVLRRKKEAERAELKAEQQREKVREWARTQNERKEEQQRQERRAKRVRERKAWGCRNDIDCPCMDCFYEFYWERHERAAEEGGLFASGFGFFGEDLSYRTRQAEKANEEAGQRAAQENDRRAKERLAKSEEAERKKKEREQKAIDRKQAARARCAEKSTQAAAHKQREEQEKMAKLRMAKQHIKEQQDKYLAEYGEVAASINEVVLDIGWKKVKGKAKCLFCDDEIKHYSFRCPDGGAIACNPCKNQMCRFAPVKGDEDVEVEED